MKFSEYQQKPKRNFLKNQLIAVSVILTFSSTLLPADAVAQSVSKFSEKNKVINHHISNYNEIRAILLKDFKKYKKINNIIYSQLVINNLSSDMSVIQQTAEALTAIGYHETRHNNNTVNINRIKLTKVSKNSFISFLTGLYMGVKDGETSIEKYLLKVSLTYTGNKKKHLRLLVDTSSEKKRKITLSKLKKFITFLNQAHNLKHVYVRTRFPIAFKFEKTQQAIKFVHKILPVTEENIDVGLFQINIKYNNPLLKKHKYTVSDMFDISKASIVAGEIFLKKLKEAKFNLFKAVGYYHNRNSNIHNKYVKKVKTILTAYNDIKSTLQAYKKIDSNQYALYKTGTNDFSLN